MTLRSALIGLFLGLAISAFTYFNDQIIRQTFLVGNHLPIFIFGLVLVFTFFVNPLLKKVNTRIALKPMEIAIACAIGLVACGWPGSSFFRSFTSIIALSSHQYPTKTAWRDAHLMSYVPGGSPEFAEGFVRNWPALTRGLGSGANAPKSPAGRLWERLPFDGREAVAEAAGKSMPEPAQRSRLIDALNKCINDRDLYTPEAFGMVILSSDARRLLALRKNGELGERDYQKLNRYLVAAALPDAFLPMPKGSGILLENGQANAPAVVSLMQGWEGKKPGLFDLPWKAWWPTIFFWGSIAVLIGLASVFLVVIVMPQWKRELLPYPIARFIHDVIEPGEKGVLPKIAQNKLFWIGFAAMVVLHTVNGLQAWFPDNIKIQMDFTFFQLWGTVPDAVLGAATYFWTQPHIYPTIVAFTFFVGTQVSFSVGISPVVFGLLSLLLVSNGVALSKSQLEIGNFSMMHFGCFCGAAMIILYLGRRYYANVVSSGIGFRRHAETPSIIPWAFRGFLVCVALVIVVLVQNGLEWYLGALVVGGLLLEFMVLTRINAETGVFFNQPDFLPVMAVFMIFGAQSLGPTVYFIMLMVTFIMAVDVRETIMPHLGNSLYLATQRTASTPVRGMIMTVLVMVVVSFATALAATLFLQYTNGLNYSDGAAMWNGSRVFDRIATQISELSAYNELGSSQALSGLKRFTAMKPTWNIVPWFVAGILLVVGCSAMRTRFAWWPIHPVLFLVWGTFFPSDVLSTSILLGWLAKVAVTRFGGAKGFHTVKPMMVGVITGELIMGLVWCIVGAIYFFATGLIPKAYTILFN